MIISIDAEKAFDKIQHSFMIKTLNKVGLDGIYLHVIKAIYDKTTSSIILKGQKLQAFPLRQGTTEMAAFTSLIQHSTGSPIHSNQIRRRNKRHPNWTGRSKTLYLQITWYPKDSTKKLLELKNEFSGVAGYKFHFLYISQFYSSIFCLFNQRTLLFSFLVY